MSRYLPYLLPVILFGLLIIAHVNVKKAHDLVREAHRITEAALEQRDQARADLAEAEELMHDLVTNPPKTDK